MRRASELGLDLARSCSILSGEVTQSDLCLKVDLSGSVRDRLEVRRLVEALQRTQPNDEV